MINPGIYIHIDPLTHEIRYVGVSSNWPKRSRDHLNPSRLTKPSTHHKRWLLKLKRAGLKPIIQCLQQFNGSMPREDLLQAEIYWIQYFKDIGCPLTNATPGGEGHTISDETKRKISQKLKKNQPVKPCVPADPVERQKQRKPLYDNFGNTYRSIKEASRITGFPVTKIQDVIHRRRPHWHGYIFYFQKPAPLPFPKT
jgi:hypothetical protein